VTRDPHDPVPDHGKVDHDYSQIMMSLRLALPSLLCNDVVWNSGLFSEFYTVA